MAYDYLLTLKDEVAELHYNNCAERDLTTSYRSVTRGGRRTFSVRKYLHFSWSAPTDGIPVFILFLFVSALHYRHHITLTMAQSRYLPPAFQTWILISEWYSINPRDMLRSNGIFPQLQRHRTRDTSHLRYVWIVSTYLL